jgi:hypothetical protein
MTRFTLPSLLAVVFLTFGCKKEPDCPAGYTGTDCTQEVAPTRMRISSIKLLKWPAVDEDGQPFDTQPGPSLPDVGVIVFRDTVRLWNAPFYYTDWPTTNTLQYAPVPAIELDDPLATHALVVFDHDPGTSGFDLVGVAEFTPYQPGRKFPGRLTAGCDDCPVQFELEVQYEHKLTSGNEKCRALHRTAHRPAGPASV